MNLKTTLALVVLAAAGGVLYWLGPEVPTRLGLAQPVADPAGAGTLAALENDLTLEKLVGIEVRHGDRVVTLEHGAGDEWTLPGKWPARKAEVEQLVTLLTNLRSRFAPEPITEETDLDAYGLKEPAVVVIARSRVKQHQLAFGEKKEEGDENRFSRPTYLRLDDLPEIVRLAPGLLAALDRPADYYQQRRLFPFDRVAKEPGSQEKVERLAAKSVTVKETKKPAENFTLTGAGDNWTLAEPVKDRADPDKLKSLLSAVPDVWAEQFVSKPKPDLAEYGLKEPEQTITVTRANGDPVTLLIGKQSQMKTRTVTRQMPQLGGPPMPPQKDVVHEEYRFAKLQGNDQIFEIKADKLKDVFVAADTLRDARLARFRADDAQRVEITQGGEPIVLAKDKGAWKLQKPLEGDAESGKITELLDKLSNLQATGPDLLDKADPKAHGLDKPAGTVKVTVEEEIKKEGETKEKKTKTFQFALGQPEKPAADKPKLYVKVEGWDRINAVEDGGLLNLVKRPALAYRGRRVLDFATADLAKVEVQRPGEAVRLKREKDAWKLDVTGTPDAEMSKANTLLDELSRLEAVEFVSEAPKPEELEKQYGLTKPELAATVTFSDEKKPAQTLQVGKQREGKPDYFAKLASSPRVFVVKKEVREALDQGSLAYRPLQQWNVLPDEVAQVRIQKEGQDEFRLVRKAADWTIAGPFDATATPGVVPPIANELVTVRAERYEAHDAKDAAKYGLDKPYLKVAVTTTVKKDDGKEETKERTLLIGKPTEKDAKQRYAKLGDADAVFVVNEKTVTAADRTALDLLNRRLLTLDPTSIEKVRSTGSEGNWTLQKQGEEWRVTEAPAAPFPADAETVNGLLQFWSNVAGSRFAAYGPKVEPAKYGLDKPDRTVTVTVQPPVGADGKKPAAVEHTLAVGKPVEGSPNERYARLDNGPGVIVLPAVAVAQVAHGHLDFVNRTMFNFDPAEVTTLQRRAGNETLEIVKRDGGWRLAKPADQPADDRTMQDLLGQLASLRAKKVAAYPSNDLQVGTGQPTVLTLSLTAADGKKSEHVLKLGFGDPMTGDKMAVADQSKAIYVVPGALARRLIADPISFRDRNVAKFTDADKASLERGPRRATFAKVDGTWKLTEPTTADAEQTELEDLINVVARLRADELVADKPKELKEYGLDKPEAKWTFRSGDKEVLSLVVGGKEKDGARHYAKLATGDVVFLLDPLLSGKVLAEYRNRTVWTAPPDAAQVETIRYQYARDPFTLEKVDNVWKVVGKPDVQVKPEAVSEMLAALAGLRVERYVVDKSADLKLYGLEPAELVLEVQVPSGKKTIHIGRPEGESKRYYARVPDKDRSEVFVLSEADSAKIVRTLAAFTEKKAAP